MAMILLTEASCFRAVGRKGLVIAPLPRTARWLRTAGVRWQHSCTRISSSTGIRTFNGGGVTILGGMFSWSEDGKDWSTGGRGGSITRTSSTFSSPNLGV